MRILILMATRTYRAEAFLTAASRLGVEVTVGTEEEQLLSHLTPGATVSLDFRHPRAAEQRILEFARDYPIDAVVGVDDATTVLAAVVAGALGLSHNSVDSVKAARYKDVMRLILSETELNAPAFQLVGIDEDPRLVTERVPYPCVIKPLSLSASRGVIRADDPSEFVVAFHEVVQIIEETDLEPNDPAAQQVLVESFIPGAELALEGLLIDGKLHVLALFDKPDPLNGPYFEETIYVTPSRVPAATQSKITEAAAHAAAALGLREGPVHAEVRINEAGPWIVEIAPRSVGGLCSNALRFDFDLSLEEIILRQAAHFEIPSLEREHQASGVMMIPIPGAGALCEVHGLEAAKAVPGIVNVMISIRPGQEVVPLPRGNRYLGFIFARGETPASVEASLREAHGKLGFDIQQTQPSLVGEVTGA